MENIKLREPLQNPMQTQGFGEDFQIWRNGKYVMEVFGANSLSPKANVTSLSSYSGKIDNVIFTRDGSYINVYVNGKFEAKTAWSTPQWSSTQNTRIGWNGGTGTSYFHGLIEEVIIENCAWSASEVKKYYTYAKGRFGIL